MRTVKTIAQITMLHFIPVEQGLRQFAILPNVILYVTFYSSRTRIKTHCKMQRTWKRPLHFIPVEQGLRPTLTNPRT